MATDFDQLEADLETALAKTLKTGIQSYTINGRFVSFHNPELLLRALEKVKQQKASASSSPATTIAEVID